MGDFNVNLLSENIASNRISDILETYNMLQVVSQPTRKANLLDIIAVSNEELVASDVIHIDMHEISDHQFIYCDMDINCNKIDINIKILSQMILKPIWMLSVGMIFTLQII